MGGEVELGPLGRVGSKTGAFFGELGMRGGGCAVELLHWLRGVEGGGVLVGWRRCGVVRNAPSSQISASF
jgi:hypothetical protein